MSARDVYIAIMVAASKGQGVRLSADECSDLAMDDAISTRASNVLTGEEFERLKGQNMWRFWETINPHKERIAGNCAVSDRSL